MESELKDTNRRHKSLKQDVKKIPLLNDQRSRDVNLLRDISMEPFKDLDDVGRPSSYTPVEILALAVEHKPKATAKISKPTADNTKVLFTTSDKD